MAAMARSGWGSTVLGILALVGMGAGCMPQVGDGDGGHPGDGNGPGDDDGADDDSAAGDDDTTPAPDDDTPPGDDDDSDSVCGRWNGDTADVGEGTFTGNVNSCDAGDWTGPGRDNALKMVNLYRWLGGLPAVTDSDSLADQAQECALMMDANNSLSHTPPGSWQCYTAAGAGAAGSSVIATLPGVAAVELYMLDSGNETTLGHRRWLLSNSLGPIGVGSTSAYSCMWVIGGSGHADAQWLAWPPPGQVPVAAMETPWGSIDQTGWSIQSDSVDLGHAEVTVTVDGVEKPVAGPTVLEPYYGSTYAISFFPQGWHTQAGRTYEVEVSGVNPGITYSVEVVDCGG